MDTVSKHSNWHRADIIAAIHKTGISLATLSRQNGLAPGTLSNALHRRWPRGEQIIADHLNLSPEEIWPSRYEKFGRVPA